jgi:hypothetical protein
MALQTLSALLRIRCHRGGRDHDRKEATTSCRMSVRISCGLI